MKHRIHRKRSGAYSMLESLIALLLATIILVAVYQTLHLQWRGLSQTTAEARLLGDGKRALAEISRQLRNSGYNPLSTPYDLKDKSKRIGLVAAYGDALVFTMDQVASDGSERPDGQIVTAQSLDALGMPVDQKSDGREVYALRRVKNRLESFGGGVNGRWSLLAEPVNRLAITYYNELGEVVAAPSLELRPAQLLKVRRLDITLQLNDAKKQQSQTLTTSVTLRNPPVVPTN